MRVKGVCRIHHRTILNTYIATEVNLQTERRKWNIFAGLVSINDWSWPFPRRAFLHVPSCEKLYAKPLRSESDSNVNHNDNKCALTILISRDRLAFSKARAWHSRFSAALKTLLKSVGSFSAAWAAAVGREASSTVPRPSFSDRAEAERFGSGHDKVSGRNTNMIVLRKTLKDRLLPRTDMTLKAEEVVQ